MKNPKPLRTQPAARGAFSLIEIITVSLILAIVAGIATPKFADAQLRSQLRTAAARVEADMRYARQQAKLAGSTRRVEFFPATDSYQLPDSRNINGPGPNNSVDLQAAFSAKIVSANFGPSGTDTTLVFDLYGKPDAAGSVVIAVGNEQRTIKVHGLTGKVGILP